MKESIYISPSVLSADFANLGRDIQMLNESEADWIHVDVMDGNFVPNISFGFPILKAIRKHTTKVLDVHLMVSDSDAYLEHFKKAGADILTVHYEACPHLARTLSRIRELGMRPAVCVNPGTPVEALEDVLHLVDMVLIMSVNPGFGGQKFIENTYTRIIRLKEMLTRLNLDVIIEIDGGVNGDNLPKLIEAGANAFVAGSYVFNSADPKATIASMKGA